MKMTDLRRLASQITPPLTPEKHEQMRSLLRQMGLDPDNLYQELEMSSAYVDTHRDTSFSNAQVQLHSHAFHEILYCIQDGGAEYLVGTRRYRLRRGDIVAVPPGVSHRPLLPPDMEEPYRRYVLWLSPAFYDWFSRAFSREASPGSEGRRLLRTVGTEWEFLGELFRQGVEEAEKQQEGWEAVVAANAMKILAALYRMSGESEVHALQAEKPELLDRILAYIEANLSGHITLADTARLFFVSESTVSQLFRRKMGVSFYRCVTQRRLIAAKALILEGMALEAVAGRTGFSDYSAFYRAFRQEFGISPRQYRSIQEGSRNKG